jgi:hypothetical protein
MLKYDKHHERNDSSNTSFPNLASHMNVFRLEPDIGDCCRSIPVGKTFRPAGDLPPLLRVMIFVSQAAFGLISVDCFSEAEPRDPFRFRQERT